MKKSIRKVSPEGAKVLLMLLIPGIILIFFINPDKTLLDYFKNILSFPKRSWVLWIISIVIGMAHALTVDKGNTNESVFFLKTPFTYLNSLLNAASYALLLNSSCHFGLGIINENLGGTPIFTTPSQIDTATLTITLTMLCVWSILGLKSMVREILFNKLHDFSDVTGVSIETMEKGKREGTHD